MTSFCRSDDVFGKVVDRSLCLLKNKDKYVYKLNDTAAFLWELLENPQTSTKLSKALTKKYKISQSQAQKDVESFLKYYLGEKLIKKVSD